MKVALSSLLLGASMLGANAKSLGQDGTETALFTDASGTYEYKLKVEEVDGLKTLTTDATTIIPDLDCELAYDRGTAYGSYGVTILTSDNTTSRTDQLSRYSKDSTLAFFCGLKINGGSLKIDDGKGAVHKDDRLLIELDGTGDCTAQFNLDTTKVKTDSNADSRIYKPKLKAMIEYRNANDKLCIMEKDLAHGNVKATLNLVPTVNATNNNIVWNMETTSSAPMTRTADKFFEAEWDATFDLGGMIHTAYTMNLQVGAMMTRNVRGKSNLKHMVCPEMSLQPSLQAAMDGETTLSYFLECLRVNANRL